MTSKDIPNRPPFASPLSSTGTFSVDEKGDESGQRAGTVPASTVLVAAIVDREETVDDNGDENG